MVILQGAQNIAEEHVFPHSFACSCSFPRDRALLRVPTLAYPGGQVLNIPQHHPM